MMKTLIQLIHLYTLRSNFQLMQFLLAICKSWNVESGEWNEGNAGNGGGNTRNLGGNAGNAGNVRNGVGMRRIMLECGESGWE